MLLVVCVSVRNDICQDFFQGHIHCERQARRQLVRLHEFSHNLTQSLYFHEIILEKHRGRFAHCRLIRSVSTAVGDGQGGNIITLLGAGGKPLDLTYDVLDSFCWRQPVRPL